jgi:hypothetical protein
MSDLQQWLTTNQEGLELIAGLSGTNIDVVHLAAVLVEAGLTDDQIIRECLALRPRFGKSVDISSRLRHALPLIRELA